MKKYLTEPALERLKAPADGRSEYGDTVVPGLMLRVTSGGQLSWSVLYKVRGEGGLSTKTGRPLKGKQRRITLGAYPIMGVKKAREAAIDVLEKSVAGTDARAVRDSGLVVRLASTVEAVARRFIEQDAKPNIESWSKIERALEMHVLPHWGGRPISDIRRRDVHDLLDRYVVQWTGRPTSRRTFSDCSMTSLVAVLTVGTWSPANACPWWTCSRPKRR